MKEIMTYEELPAENASMKAKLKAMKANERLMQVRIAYLERMLYGGKSDRLIGKEKEPDNQPGLFDEFFKEEMDEKTARIEETAKEIEAETRKRRERSRKEPSRPSQYRYAGLEERRTVIMPDGLDESEYDIIGTDVTRILHREPAKVWVEVIERPILRRKAEKDSLYPRIYQAKAPQAVIGGNHIAADMLSQIIIDKYRYHLPEYRQVRQYADLGVRLPTSTLNGWVHTVACKLAPPL